MAVFTSLWTKTAEELNLGVVRERFYQESRPNKFICVCPCNCCEMSPWGQKVGQIALSVTARVRDELVIFFKHQNFFQLGC